MRTLVAATCLSIMAAIGYYFWSEHQAVQERERTRIEIAAKESEAAEILEKQKIEKQQREEQLAKEQKIQAEEAALNKMTSLCEINQRNFDAYNRSRASRFTTQTDQQLEIEAMLRRTTERCIEHYKMMLQRESVKMMLKLQEIISDPNL
jgi:hypothetical protein